MTERGIVPSSTAPSVSSSAQLQRSPPRTLRSTAPRPPRRSGRDTDGQVDIFVRRRAERAGRSPASAVCCASASLSVQLQASNAAIPPSDVEHTDHVRSATAARPGQRRSQRNGRAARGRAPRTAGGSCCSRGLAFATHDLATRRRLEASAKTRSFRKSNRGGTFCEKVPPRTPISANF